MTASAPATATAAVRERLVRTRDPAPRQQRRLRCSRTHLRRCDADLPCMRAGRLLRQQGQGSTYGPPRALRASAANLPPAPDAAAPVCDPADGTSASLRAGIGARHLREKTAAPAKSERPCVTARRSACAGNTVMASSTENGESHCVAAVDRGRRLLGHEPMKSNSFRCQHAHRTRSAPIRSAGMRSHGACAVCRPGGRETACPSTRPVCDPSNTCIVCDASNAGCSGTSQCLVVAGMSAMNSCVDCIDDTGCSSTATNNKCNTATHACVDCLAPADCVDTSACTTSACIANVCSFPPIVGIDDGLTCTTDSCDPVTGVIISHMSTCVAGRVQCTAPPVCSADPSACRRPCRQTCATPCDPTATCVGTGGAAGSGCAAGATGRVRRRELRSLDRHCL